MGERRHHHVVDVPSCNLRDEGFGREDGRWGTRKGEEPGGELARCLLCRSIALFRDSVFV